MAGTFVDVNERALEKDALPCDLDLVKEPHHRVQRGAQVDRGREPERRAARHIEGAIDHAGADAVGAGLGDAVGAEGGHADVKSQGPLGAARILLAFRNYRITLAAALACRLLAVLPASIMVGADT